MASINPSGQFLGVSLHSPLASFSGDEVLGGMGRGSATGTLRGQRPNTVTDLGDNGANTLGMT